MPRPRFLLILVLALFWGPGHGLAFWPFSSSDPPDYPQVAASLLVSPAPARSGEQIRELQLIIRRLAETLADKVREHEQGGTGGLIVTSFVDLNQLRRSSSLGRHLAEQMMTEFQSMGFTMVEARKTTSVLIAENGGEFGLSRNLEEIASSFSAEALVLGTYLPSAGHVLINARIVSNRDSTLWASGTAILPRNELVEALLRDAATVAPRQEGVVYLKKLTVE